MYDSTVDFTQEQLDQINQNYLTVPVMREFWSLFPDFELAAVIGDLKTAFNNLVLGKELPNVPEARENTPALDGFFHAAKDLHDQIEDSKLIVKDQTTT